MLSKPSQIIAFMVGIALSHFCLAGAFTPLYKGSPKILYGSSRGGEFAVARIVGSKKLYEGSTLMLQATILGGRLPFDDMFPKWNESKHTLVIGCSKSIPTIDGELLHLKPEGISGVEETGAAIYFAVCHSYFGSAADGAKRFGYNIAFR